MSKCPVGTLRSQQDAMCPRCDGDLGSDPSKIIFLIDTSETICSVCAEKSYEKRHPNWRDPKPCMICQTMIYYRKGLSSIEWNDHYCCSDKCRSDYHEYGNEDSTPNEYLTSS